MEVTMGHTESLKSPRWGHAEPDVTGDKTVPTEGTTRG